MILHDYTRHASEVECVRDIIGVLGHIAARVGGCANTAESIISCFSDGCVARILRVGDGNLNRTTQGVIIIAGYNAGYTGGRVCFLETKENCPSVLCATPYYH